MDGHIGVTTLIMQKPRAIALSVVLDSAYFGDFLVHVIGHNPFDQKGTTMTVLNSDQG